MENLKSDNTKIWMELLNKDPKTWNKYLYAQYRDEIDSLPEINIDKFWEQFDIFHHHLNANIRDKDSADSFGEKHLGWPPWPANTPESFMNFTKESIPENFSFSGRLYIGADFRNIDFKGVDFRGAVFLGLAHFGHSKFFQSESCKLPETNVVSFKNSSFYNNVHFNNTLFRVDTEFENVQFKNKTHFEGVSFEKEVSFNDSKFYNTISFQGASFGRPPKFYSTSVHEDVSFDGIDWSGAEYSYSRYQNKINTEEQTVEKAEMAIRAWDRLSLVMSRQEKFWERHEFFRLKMRAKRQTEERTISSIANLLFDKLSDYGWGIRRSFTWWFGHIVFFGFFLADAARIQAIETGSSWSPKYILDGILVSFSNAHNFLRLDSERRLGSIYDSLEGATNQMVWFSAVGFVQAVLGPILLFLVLLTLRNRFRIG